MINISRLTVPKNLLLVFVILFSIATPFAGSRYGIRIEQIFIYFFVVAFTPYLFLKTNVFRNRYLFVMGVFFFIYLPIYLEITNSIAFYSVYQAFFRVFGFALLGYLLANYYSYTKFYKGVVGLSFVFLLLSYFQIYHILNLNTIFRILYDGGIAMFLYDALPTTTFGLSEYTSSFILMGFVSFFVYFMKERFVKKLLLAPILASLIYYFMFCEARSALVAIVYFIFVFLLIGDRKKLFFNISIMFLLIGIGAIFYLYQYIMESKDLIDRSIWYRLEETWAKPIYDWLDNPISFLYGAGLSNNYADSGYTSFLGAYGLLGFILFYLPILMMTFELKKDYIQDKYLTYFYYTTMLLLIVNITYPVFTGGKFADIYWLMFGATVKYLIYYKKELRNKTI